MAKTLLGNQRCQPEGVAVARELSSPFIVGEESSSEYSAISSPRCTEEGPAVPGESLSNSALTKSCQAHSWAKVVTPSLGLFHGRPVGRWPSVLW